MNAPFLCLLPALVAGAAAALLELWWLRHAASALPGTVPAAALVVPSFLALWTLGSAVAGRAADRARGARGQGRGDAGQPAARQHVVAALDGAARWFALGAVAALLVPRLLELILPDPVPSSWPWRLVLGTIPAAPAAFLMAGTLPWLTSVRGSAGIAPRRAAGGVACSVAVGGLLGCVAWPHVMGAEPGAVTWSALGMAAAAAGAWLLARLDAGARIATSDGESSAPAVADGRSERVLALWLFVGGGVLVAGQLALLRLHIQWRGDSIVTSAELLAALYAGMALGALGLVPLTRMLPAGLLVGGLLLLAGLGLALPGLAGEALGRWPAWAAALALGVPLGLGTGSLVTAASGAARRERARFGSWVGDMAAVSTAGGVAGGLVYLHVISADPDVGTAAGLHAMSVVCALTGLCACLAAARGPMLAARASLACWCGVALAVVCVPLTLWFPSPELPWQRAPDEVALLGRVEGPDGVLSWMSTTGGGDRIKLDNLRGLGGQSSAPIDRRMGRVAAALAPKAQRTLALGLGRGHTLMGIWTTTRARVECVERNAQLVQLVRDELGLPYDRTRVVRPAPPEIHVDDARSWLSRHADTYDLIVGDLFFPWVTGAGDLLTEENFLLMRRALRADGVVVQWLPLHQLPWPAFRSVTQSFLRAFPSARLFVASPLANQPLAALVGGLERGLPEAELVDELLAASRSAGGPNGMVDLYDLHVAGPWVLGEMAGDVAPSTLQHPSSELLSVRRHADEAFIARTNMRQLAALVQPLTGSSLALRPVDDKDLRKLSHELVNRAAALQGLLAARAAALELSAARAGGDDEPRTGRRAVRRAALAAPDASLPLAELDVDTWRLPRERQQLDEEIDAWLRHAWRSFPGHTGVRIAALERAAQLSERGAYQQAGTLLEALLDERQDGGLGGAFGGILLQLGYDEQALEVLSRAYALTPGDRGVLVHLGSALVRNERDDQALSTLREARAAFGARPLPAASLVILALLEDEPGARDLARELIAELGDDERWVPTLRRLAAG